jgi:hypothetical protein
MIKVRTGQNHSNLTFVFFGILPLKPDGVMHYKLNRLLFLIRQDVGLYLGISLGIFLFILFFQPFSPDRFDLNNWLLFVAGIAAIVYLFLILVRILLRWIIRDKEQIYDEP